MATILPTKTQQGPYHIESFALTTANHTGAPIAPSLPAGNRCVQLSGTWGGATAILEGSVDGTTYFGLEDDVGTAISATANAFFTVAQCPPFVRPRLSVVGSGAAVTVAISCR